MIAAGPVDLAATQVNKIHFPLMVSEVIWLDVTVHIVDFVQAFHTVNHQDSDLFYGII